MKNENREHCKSIALELEAYAEGRVYRCPECSTHVQDNVLFCECGEQVDLIEGEWEQCSLYDYLEDVLDIEYTIQSDRQTVKGVRLLVAFGGPNIYVDTIKKAVTLYWWTEYAEYALDTDVCDDLDEIAQEHWDMG